MKKKNQWDLQPKRVWDRVQDDKLVSVIAELGPAQWDNVAQRLSQRTGKQCRERWHNQVNPMLKKAPWSPEEDWILYILQETKQNHWAEFKNILIGRCDNSIKNYWNSTLRHRSPQFEKALSIYLKGRSEGLNPCEITAKRSILMHSLL